MNHENEQQSSNLEAFSTHSEVEIEENLFSKSTSRRALLAASALAAIGIAGCGGSPTESTVATTPAQSTESNSTYPSGNPLQALLDGNQRFQRGQAKWPNQTVARRQAVSRIAKPLAFVVGSPDPRVPPELIFDQGLGDLVVFRTPVNMVDDVIIGNIEVSISAWPVPLLIVLGGSHDAIVMSAIQAIDQHTALSKNLQPLADYLRPSILKAEGVGIARVTNAIHNNIIYTMNLFSKSTTISDAVNAKTLTIVGGYYDTNTGAVSIVKD